MFEPYRPYTDRPQQPRQPQPDRVVPERSQEATTGIKFSQEVTVIIRPKIVPIISPHLC